MAKLLSRKEAWTRLNVSQSALNRIVASGALRSHKIGGLVKISEHDLQEYLDAVAHGGRPAKA